MTTARSEFLSGVQAELPILLGVAPFGMIYGALAIGAGLPVGMAQAMSAIVFAGSAQFIAAQLIGGGAPGPGAAADDLHRQHPPHALQRLDSRPTSARCGRPGSGCWPIS